MKNLILVVVLLATIAIAQPWQEVTSQYSKYTIQYPTDWTVGNAYYNNTPNVEVISEHTVLYNDFGAKITIDVWRSHPKLTLEQWLDVMLPNFQLGNAVLEKTTATQENLPAYHYAFEGSVQAYNSQMVVFKYRDRAFRISYLEKDQGEACSVYQHLIQTMRFNDHSIVELSPLPTSRPPTRVYTCGNQNDTCQCSADNPYPCCDNGGNCTWWAWEKACCNWGVGLPSPWRNAMYWAGDLSAHGYHVSSSPRVNSIACSGRGTYGHVAWVLEVSGSKVRVSEMNCCSGCNYGVREAWYESSYFTNGYIYR